MFSIFKFSRQVKKRRKGKSPAAMTRVFWSLQASFVRRLDLLQERLTLTEKKIGLLIFCAGMLIMSAWLLYEGIRPGKEQPPSFLKPARARIPVDTRLPDTLDIRLLRERVQQDSATRHHSLPSEK